MKRLKLAFENADTKQRIYATEKGRAIARGHFVALGFKYFQTYKDTRGFGLNAIRQASWQCESSKPVTEEWSR